MLTNKKILITGAAGFLGLHLTHFFENLPVQAGQGVVLTLVDIAPFDEHEYGKKHNTVTADIRDKKEMRRLMKGQDFVIHAAAALPLWKKADIYSTNIDGTKIVLDATLSAKVKRVVYISSTAVYGVPKKHPT